MNSFTPAIFAADRSICRVRLQKAAAIDPYEILPEYDFSHARPNKSGPRYAADSMVFVLDPDVAAAFPTSAQPHRGLLVTSSSYCLPASVATGSPGCDAIFTCTDLPLRGCSWWLHRGCRLGIHSRTVSALWRRNRHLLPAQGLPYIACRSAFDFHDSSELGRRVLDITNLRSSSPLQIRSIPGLV